MRSEKPINILDIKFCAYNQYQVLNVIGANIESGRKALILSGNIQSFNLCYKNEWLKTLFNQADVVRIDGEGLRLGARMLGYELPERMTWADFAWDLAKLCSERDYSIYLLGGRIGVAEKAAHKLKARNPDLRIVGKSHGFFDKTPGSSENNAVIQEIYAAAPDILIVGFGMPIQEKWIYDNWDDIHAKVIMTGGAVFEYVSGEVPRAPQWMTDNGLEWLGRFLIEPRRLWKRYLIGNPLFFWRILKQRLRFTSSG
ncbi:MAG: WecB/TagA/CpsF family glycosyltransferase [Anaerolineales bacterium]|nr:WecB/TagA/CpsF family glycosyltransferase [Anaerolineales bacterium]